MTATPSLKILFFAEHFRLAQAGAENDLVMLCRALARRGHRIHVLSETNDEFENITTHKGLANSQTTIDTVQPDITVDWGFFHKADIHRVGGGVHEAFLPYSMNSYSPVMRALKRISHRISAKHIEQREKEREILQNRNALFLPISNFVARQLLDAGVPEADVKVLYNGVDTVRFTPPQDEDMRTEIREQWRVGADDIAFLFVAHNLRLKNMKLLHRVFEALSEKNPHLKLVVAGKRAPGFTAPYLVYIGQSDHIEKCYAGADCLLHPSFYDSFANVVLEAMSCSLPVIVSSDTGANELIESGKNGMILPVAPGRDSRKQWRDAVDEMAANPEARQILGRNARKTAEAHEHKKYVDEFEQIILHKYADKNKRESTAVEPA